MHQRGVTLTKKHINKMCIVDVVLTNSYISKRGKQAFVPTIARQASRSRSSRHLAHVAYVT